MVGDSITSIAKLAPSGEVFAQALRPDSILSLSKGPGSVIGQRWLVSC